LLLSPLAVQEGDEPSKQGFRFKQRKENVTMSPEKLDAVTTELKRFGQSLNLSDDQKTQLRSILTETHSKIQAYKQQNPNISRQDLIQKITSMRHSLRSHVVKFLTPDQLKTWDAEVAKGREFLGQNIAA
jgi:hypothetical protein